MLTPLYTLESLVEARLQWLEVHNYSASTIDSEMRLLLKFQWWCERREIRHPKDVSFQVIESYQRWLASQKTKEKKKFSVNYQRKALGRVQQCFEWAYKQGHILLDPSVNLKLPRKVKPLPAQVLSLVELESVLKVPDTTTALGLRDRALLEVLYSTAIRLGELLNLKTSDLDRSRELLWIRQGKGKKDRMVPISQRALDWINQYDQRSRELLLNQSKRSDALFLSRNGKPLDQTSCNARVTGYIRQVALDKKGSCHLIRHSVATILMERGCHVSARNEIT